MKTVKQGPAISLGIVITLIFLALSISRFGFLEALELRFYDARMQLRGASAESDNIVLVDIDNESIEKIGQWPWPRSVIAKGLDKIRGAAPKVIGLNILYSETEDSSGMRVIRNLIEMVESQGGQQNEQLLNAMRMSLKDLDNDAKLKQSMEKTKNIILPVVLKESEISSRSEVDPKLSEAAIPDVSGSGEDAYKSNEIIRPIPPFFDAADGIGHVNLATDVDGTVRSDILLYQYRNLYLPSYSLMLAAKYLDVPELEISANLGERVSLSDVVTVPVTRRTEMLVNFKGANGSFKRYNFFDIYSQRIPPENLPGIMQDKIVIITLSAAGIMNPLATPTSERMSLGEFTANAIDTILNRRFIRQPAYRIVYETGMIALVGALIILVIPRLKAMLAGTVFVSVACLMIGGAIFSFTSAGLWVRIIYPLLQLITGYIGVVTLNFFITEAGKEKAEGESAANNRDLGLALQSEGRFDEAFLRFRKVPVDDDMKSILYSLGLDYERKRQHNKAAQVYEYIEEYDPGYKDVTEKRTRLKRLSDSEVLGDNFLNPGTNSGDPLLGTNSDIKPTLGRYEVQKRLGKGAMGVVYLGLDPRINRTTAIKTFRFTDDFEPDEAERMKQRFFREAESAGNLSHPNIVAIYDAGDEQDLAYIAMEYLEGEDLQKYTRKNNLLPMRKVIDHCADIADALDYAHSKGIVHRDIKPANIMLLKSGIVKITDFGIARITSTSHTQTGVVKGTPHYMSPEQISGQKVNGQSDIFSLGTMMYQLLTGELPFRGESPAALMYQITNVRQPDPRKYNPKLLKPLVLIIDRALEKDRKKRYQRASTMAKHLRTLGAKIDALIAQKRASGAQKSTG